MWSYDPLYAWTVEEMLKKLPGTLFQVKEVAEATELDYYGRSLRVAYTQAYLSYVYNGFTVPYLWSYALWGAIGLLLAIGIIRQHITAHIFSRTPKILQPTRDLLVKHFYLSALAGSSAAEPISYIGARRSLRRWTSVQVPRRLHGLIVLVFVVITVGIGFVGYKIATPTVFSPAIGYAFPSYLRSFADRLGVQAIVLTPLVFLLAGRNSPFIWMTGVDYPTLQLYHRWVARMAVYTALGHCIGYCFVYVIDNPTSFYESFHEAYWNWGWAALVGGLFLCLSSIRRVREICYEVFLLCHIGGAMLWLVGCYYHIYSLNPKYSFLKYLYATIAFWVFERATRTVWSSYYTFGKATSKGFQFGADAKIIECGSYSRLIINPARPLPDRFSGPGSYIFVRSVDGRFFESHPFTIAFPSGMPRLCSPAQTPDPEGKNTFLGSRGSQLSDNEDQGGKAFELIIRTYSGWTRTLRDRTKPLKLLLEGPYGASTSLDHYDSALLIAGGSGISATIAHFADLAKCLDRAEGDYKLTLQRIVIVWAIRDPQSAGILVIYLARLRGLLGNINVDLHIYYTGEISSIQKIRGLSAFSSTEQLSCVRSSQGLLAITSICSPLTSMLKTLSIHTGRPDIVNYLDDLLSEGGKIGVIACGPEGLCDRARLGVKSRMRETTSDDLIYHEESFTW